jgi:nicotinamidase-related amidase
MFVGLGLRSFSMPIDLRQLAAPDHTAVLTMEMQRGVIGDLAAMPSLADAAREAGIVEPTARLLAAARAHGVRVVHCTAEFRADRAGSVANSPMLAVAMRKPSSITMGSEAAQVMAELGPQPSDLVSPRMHGLSPFTGTSLDVTLRNLGIRTVVATGMSVNIGIFGMLLEATNLGYSAVLPRDCVTGIPADYAQAVVNNSLALLATLTTADDLIALWQ